MIRTRVTLLGILLSLCVAYVAGVFAVQRKLLFPRPPASPTLPRPSDAQQIWLALGTSAHARRSPPRVMRPNS